ncbi:MAG TPA: hypothetical protein VGK06_12635 [Methanosarcina sp.]|jgi:hypothetical protein
MVSTAGQRIDIIRGMSEKLASNVINSKKSQTLSLTATDADFNH